MMKKQYSSKIRRRTNNNNTDSDPVIVDRISALPDCILTLILSLLATKDAVATSLLSKRWKFSWLDITNLHFAFTHISGIHLTNDDHRIKAFIHFVNKALTDGKRGPINKFSLLWETCVIPAHVFCWIDAAIRRNVSQIDLYLDDQPDCFNLFELPITCFNCDSLRCLQLYGVAFVSEYDTTMVRLPRLETLILDFARFTCEDAFEKFIHGCPMLHYLKLCAIPDVEPEYDEESNDDDDAEENFIYSVSSPSLRHLDVDTVNRCTLKLNAPSLEYIRLHGPISEIFVEGTLSSLDQAIFNIQLDEHRLLMSNQDDFPYDSIVEAVHALEHANFLTLSAHVMLALNHGRINMSTKFDSLVKLETEIFYCHWRSLHDLIQSSDNLQLLTITHQGPKLRDNNHPDRLEWTTLAEVPRCFSRSLKKIVFDGYHGRHEDEDDMIRYMLTNASVLEMMHITCAGNMNTTVQKIGKYPMKSPLCVVKFSGSMPNGDDVEVCFSARPKTRRFSKLS